MLGVARSALSATSLLDTVELLPGPDVYAPQQMALNHNTHRLYVVGAIASGYQNIGIKALDTTTGAIAAHIDLGRRDLNGVAAPFQASGIAVDESTTAGGNKVYVVGQVGNQFYLRTIEGDAVVAGSDLLLPSRPYGTVGSSTIAVNSRTHRVYYVDQDGRITVVNGPNHSIITSYGTGVGTGPHVLLVNPAANKIFVFGRDGAAVIDGNSDAVSPITLPSEFGAVTAVYNPVNGRIYVSGNTDAGAAIHVFDGSTGAFLSSKPMANRNIRGLTIDAATNTLYAGSPTLFNDGAVIEAFNAADLSVRGSFNVGAAALEFDAGRLFLLDYDYSRIYPAARNNIGILDPANGSIVRRTLGHTPRDIAINAITNRVYVTDQEAPEMVVLNGADHSVVARVPVNVTSSDPYYATESGPRRSIAVSEALNRIYLSRSEQIADDGTKTAFVDVIDGATHQLIKSIALSTNYAGHVGSVTVDDNRRRVYATTTLDNNDGAVVVIDSETNAISRTVPIGASANGIIANPVTGRIYVNGSGKIHIFDAEFQSRAVVTAGAVPGPMAVNTVTNKIYVANVGAESADNTVTVINGATDSVETTFANTNQNNGNAVTFVAVDESTNTIYVGDDSNQFDLTGRISIFSGGNNTFRGQVEVGNYPWAIAFNRATKELYVSNTNDGTVSVIGSGIPPAPPKPPNGGLSATVFRVNGSAAPTSGVADSALHFSAQQSGTPEGLVVRVQVNTVGDNNRNDWVDLNNGSRGYMTRDLASGQFVLSSTNYPLTNGIYFRALSTAAGFPDSASNIVGPFNLTSGKTHLSPTTLFLATNGKAAEMKFQAKVAVEFPAMTLRIQATTTPDEDASWSDLNDGRSGNMYSTVNPRSFYLDTTSYPPGDAVYFRAVTTALDYVPSISNIIGVRDVVVGAAPLVEVLPPMPEAGSGGGLSPHDPIVVSAGTFRLGAQASSPESRAVGRIKLMYDGVTIDTSGANAAQFTIDYTTTVPGDHVIKAAATDDRGITGYATPVYIRIPPPDGNIFTMIASGSWTDANVWRDRFGQPGVPGATDFAVINGFDASLPGNIVVGSLTLNGGSLTGGLTIERAFQLVAGQLRNINLTIGSQARMTLVGDENVPMSGQVTNQGELRITGRGGIVPVLDSSSYARRAGGDSQISRDGIFDGVAAFFRNVGKLLFSRPSTPPKPKPVPSTPPPVELGRGITASVFENRGKLITNDGGSLITNDGGSIITHDGASIITHDGASLITNDGGSVISNDGGSLITNDGGSLIGNDGAGIRVPGGAAVREPRFRAASAQSGFVQTSGETDLRNLLIIAPVSLEGGVLSGAGVIAGQLSNSGGFVSPGSSAGTISVLGDYTQGPAGTLIVENAGPGEGLHDQLQVTGAANLDGKLIVRTIDGYAANAADTFNPLGYGSVSGAFASVTGNTQLMLNATGALAAMNPFVANPPAAKLLNIATRMRVEQGDNALIAGFIITGSAPKKVIIRALGPSIEVAGRLNDPTLELFKPDGSTVFNNNWREDEGEVQATTIPPPNDLESAIVATLDPGGYTAVLRGFGDTTGVGLIEVYDLDGAAPETLANISTLGQVQIGDNVMIGGLIIGGDQPAKVLIRAIGPSLEAAGVAGVLQDPTLELVDGEGNIVSNDDWRESQEADIAATTIPPANSREAAILALLPPGNYTAIVRGRDETTGVALVEAYNLP